MKLASASFVLFFLSIFLSSCALVEGIFKAGVWVGILTVVGIIALIIFLISKFSKKN